MPDDPRDKPRRAPTATERVLAEAKRRRTNPQGVPVEVDHEDTPPPADPSLLTVGEMARLDALAQIRVVAQASADNAAAIAHEQQERRRGEDLARELGTLETKVASHAAVLSEMLGAAQHVESLLGFTAKLGDKIERLLIASEVQEQRDEDLATQMDRLFTLVGGLQTRIGQLEGAINLIGQRVEALEANLGDRIRQVELRVGAVEAKTNRLDTRSKVTVALTRSERAKVGGVGAVIGGIAAWLAKHFLGG